MRKLNDKELEVIFNLLNGGRGDCWNSNYGIFRPMKEWNKLEWLQYVVVTVAFMVGVFNIDLMLHRAAEAMIDPIIKAKEKIDKFTNRIKNTYTKATTKITVKEIVRDPETGVYNVK